MNTTQTCSDWGSSKKWEVLLRQAEVQPWRREVSRVLNTGAEISPYTQGAAAYGHTTLLSPAFSPPDNISYSPVSPTEDKIEVVTGCQNTGGILINAESLGSIFWSLGTGKELIIICKGK